MLPFLFRRRPSRRAVQRGAEFETAVHEAFAVESEGWAPERVGAAWAAIHQDVPRFMQPPLVIWDQQPNALTACDGRIYVSRELLSRGLDEAGTAFLLAHEVAHHRLGHFDALYRAHDRLGHLPAGDRLADIVAAFTAPHGPACELDADEMASQICERAGYGPLAGASLFKILRDFALEHRAHDHVWAGTLGHPALDERMAALHARQLPSDAIAAVGADHGCGTCAVRVVKARACPHCGARLRPLHNRSQRGILMASAAASSPGPGAWRATRRLCGAALLVVIVIAPFLASDFVDGLWFVACAALPIVVMSPLVRDAFKWYGFRRIGRGARPGLRPSITTDLVREALAMPLLRGRVVATTPDPRLEPGVAAVRVCDASESVVNDVFATSFTVELTDGARVVVMPSRGSVFRIPAKPASESDRSELEMLLPLWLVERVRGPLSVGTIAIGDEVELRGGLAVERMGAYRADSRLSPRPVFVNRID